MKGGRADTQRAAVVSNRLARKPVLGDWGILSRRGSLESLVREDLATWFGEMQPGRVQLYLGWLSD